MTQKIVGVGKSMMCEAFCGWVGGFFSFYFVSLLFSWSPCKGGDYLLLKGGFGDKNGGLHVVYIMFY